MGCIPGVIHLKMSADKHVIHLKKAPKSKNRVITYLKKKSTQEIPKLLKMGGKGKISIFFFG